MFLDPSKKLKMEIFKLPKLPKSKKFFVENNSLQIKPKPTDILKNFDSTFITSQKNLHPQNFKKVSKPFAKPRIFHSNSATIVSNISRRNTMSILNEEEKILINNLHIFPKIENKNLEIRSKEENNENKENLIEKISVSNSEIPILKTETLNQNKSNESSSNINITIDSQSMKSSSNLDESSLNKVKVIEPSPKKKLRIHREEVPNNIFHDDYRKDKYDLNIPLEFKLGKTKLSKDDLIKLIKEGKSDSYVFHDIKQKYLIKNYLDQKEKK